MTGLTQDEQEFLATFRAIVADVGEDEALRVVYTIGRSCGLPLSGPGAPRTRKARERLASMGIEVQP